MTDRDTPPPFEPLPIVRLSRVQSTDDDAVGWLVTDLWAEGGVGCIGGSPKSCKTWLALELACAVASGKHALGRFSVPRPGYVLVVAAEDTPVALRDRALGIARARGFDLDRTPVGLITEPGFHLDDLTFRGRLDATLEKVRPRLLVLDPLVRLHRGDENSSADVSELLGWLRRLQRRHGVAVLLVHHVRKAGAAQPGQALRGSGDLHAWGDSNLYLLREGDRIAMHMEHRGHPAPAPLWVRLAGTPAPLEVEDRNAEPEEPGDPLERKILSVLGREPLSRTALRERLAVRNETLGAVLERLVASGAILRHQGLLSVPVPRSGAGTERGQGQVGASSGG